MATNDTTVVTYVQANGRQAMTTVTPQQQATLRAAGRLVKVHKTSRRRG